MAYDALILKGTTSQMFEVMIRDATTGQGKTGVAFGSVAARYQREGAAASAAVTVVSASLGTFTSGGWVEVDATNCPGLYQVGAPNAALASGANAVTFVFKVSGAIDKAVRVVLTGAVDFAAAAGGTNAAIPFGSGVGQLNPATGRVDVGKLNGSSNAALYWQKMLDSTIFPTATATGTSTSRSFTLDSALANGSADMVGGLLWKVSGKPFKRRITSYTASSPAVVTWNEPVTGQPALDGSEVYVIIPATEVDRGTDARVLLSANAQTGVTIPTVTTLTNDPAGLATLLSRITAARAGYLDNLNVGGVVASQADINALNQSASRRVILTTVPQYERPESGSVLYTVEARTYGRDGNIVNADTTPTLTATGQTSGSLSAKIGVAANPDSGVYRWTYTVASGDATEPVRFDLAATVEGDSCPMSVHTQVTDFVAATFTTADRTLLNTAATQATAAAAYGTNVANVATGTNTINTNLLNLGTNVAGVTGSLAAMISGNKFTAPALSNAPAGGGGGGTTVNLEIKEGQLRVS